MLRARKLLCALLVGVVLLLAPSVEPARQPTLPFAYATASTDGISLYLANKILNHLTSNGTWTPPSAIYAELHTFLPGAAGTSAMATGTSARKLATYNASTANAATLTAPLGPWTNTGGSSETLTDVAFWDASSAGNFLWSAPLPAPHTWNPGDTFTLTSATNKLYPLAAS